MDFGQSFADNLRLHAITTGMAPAHMQHPVGHVAGYDVAEGAAEGCYCDPCREIRYEGPRDESNRVACRAIAESEAAESEAATAIIAALTADDDARKVAKKTARNAARRQARANQQSSAMARSRRMALAVHGQRTINRVKTAA